MTDNVNHPPHYKNHPSGVECITITEHMGFNLGNAMKYIWRCDEKGNEIEDLKKAAWYINREIQKRTRVNIKPGEITYVPSNFPANEPPPLKSKILD